MAKKNCTCASAAAASAPWEQGVRSSCRIRSNQRWSLDFVSYAFTDGRQCQVLGVVNDHTRVCLPLVGDTWPSGRRVLRELDSIIAQRGTPAMVVSDNDAGFTSMAILRWSQERQIDRHNIAPGMSVHSGFIVSFNGNFRDECLSETLCASLPEARMRIGAWKDGYNDHRPRNPRTISRPAKSPAIWHGKTGHLGPNINPASPSSHVS